MFYTQLFRDDGSGGSGGGLQNLVEGLQELDNIPSGGDTRTPEQIEAEKVETQQAAIKLEAFENDGITLKAGYMKDDKGLVQKDPDFKPATAPVEGLDDKGELLAGYKKDEQGNVIRDPDYKEAPLTPEEQTEAFWAAVNKITGDDLDIEYPPNVDPISPEGIAYYTKVIRDDAAQAFEAYLQQNFARPWAYMLHYKNGGSDETFFNDKGTGYQLPAQETFDASADLQTAVYKHELKMKGLDDDSIESLVAKAIKDNKLKEKADAAYKTIDDAQKKQIDDIAKLDTQKKETTTKAITALVEKIDQAIAGKDLRFVIPDTEKKSFREFAINAMRYDAGTGTFSVVHKVEGDQLNEILEALFFQHKKGDLKSLVEKQSKTNAAQSLKLRMKPAGGGTGSGGTVDKGAGEFIPLSAMTQ